MSLKSKVRALEVHSSLKRAAACLEVNIKFHDSCSQTSRYEMMRIALTWLVPFFRSSFHLWVWGNPAKRTRKAKENIWEREDTGNNGNRYNGKKNKWERNIYYTFWHKVLKVTKEVKQAHINEEQFTPKSEEE